MRSKRNVLLSFFFWICLWECYSIWKGERIFFPSLEMVVSDGILLLQSAFFWKTLGLTILRVAVGFGLCCSLSVVLALLTFWKREMEILWIAFFGVCRILPSVVLIVLLLVFVPLICLPFVIQACVVLPLMYEQALKSLESFEQDISLFLRFYRISYWKRFRKVYLPKIFREMYKNLESILGLCFKVTIAGELLAQEETSVGGEIFTQKMYLNLSTVFAWCFVLLLLHFFMLLLLKRFGVGYESLDRSSL
ncbi:ABC transporter permease subunit [Fusobacterium necrophorum]|uniref:ABC transporter permease subunit n=1 Tax=Fusobacterium necrophorum TaxID=859 RepID=A0A4Q2KWE4_9FUSO|nr:ABC transporter permease subunit [Fusobacterium necrophorum]RXZ69217.1 ABC transporter permease subunit [Fusobacterium necrophorum]